MSVSYLRHCAKIPPPRSAIDLDRNRYTMLELIMSKIYMTPVGLHGLLYLYPLADLTKKLCCEDLDEVAFCGTTTVSKAFLFCNVV